MVLWSAGTDTASMPSTGWARALELAWASYATGTTPVGAVVLDPAGEIVAEGRGRRYEPVTIDQQLAHCHIAHAEINALAMLPPTRHYEDHVLLTTLEPCCMCVGAAVQSTITRVRYAGRDAYGGASRLAVDTPQARRRPLTVSGPEPDPVGRLAELLSVMWLAKYHPGPPLEHQQSLGDTFTLGTRRDVIERFDTLAAAAAPLEDVLGVVQGLVSCSETP